VRRAATVVRDTNMACHQGHDPEPGVTLGSMAFPDDPSPAWDAGDLRAEALEVVSDALQWRLAGERWQAIGQILAAMDAAVAAGDTDALAAATADLELAGPVRITRIGAVPVVPASKPVAYQLNRLVHSLGGTVVPEPADVDPGTDDDRAPGD
jgi:hypothetical protein